MKWLSGVVFLFLVTLGSCKHIQMLNGTNWKLSGYHPGTKEKFEPAPNPTIPGGIFTDLMNAGVIGNVFAGTGPLDTAWVGETDWTYSLGVQVDEGTLALNNVFLVFEGLDTFATVVVNGFTVGEASNMFVRYAFDVKPALQLGINLLEVNFRSAVTVGEEFKNEQNAEYPVPPECPPTEYQGICNANQLRKMQASFSWDWGPAFASVGIWKDVYLETFDQPAFLVQATASAVRAESGTGWDVIVTAYFDGAPDSGTINVAVQTESGQVRQGFSVQVARNDFGELQTQVTLTVADTLVQRWWPNGYGTQSLYEVTVQYTSGGVELSEASVNIGFRTIELVQEPIDSGLTFYFKVNDVPIFAKGANEIPLSLLPELGRNPTTAQYILQSAQAVNMNMLRVWGGGVYEDDVFYSLADQLGILIWQDFMFACSLYPSRESYLATVTQEVRHQVKRLSSHASIALFAGNNEIELSLMTNWYGTNDSPFSQRYKDDYIALFVNTVGAEVKRLAPNSIYLTASPTNGDQSIADGYLAQDPQSSFFGDVHYYRYDGDTWYSINYPVPRFASEFGLQSMPAIESWLTATDNISNIHPDSEFVRLRQHHPGGQEQNLALITNQLNLPPADSPNYISTYIYYLQIVQAVSVKVEVEHYRSFAGRYDENGQGNTMGALYWQLNDVWVAPTWSGIDFAGRWKMLHYYAGSFFQNRLITGALEGGVEEGDVVIYAVSDIPGTFTGSALIHIYRFDDTNELASFNILNVVLEPVTAREIARITQQQLVNVGCGDDAFHTCFFHMHLFEEDGITMAAPINLFFLGKLKDSIYVEADVKIDSIVQADETGTTYVITVSSDAIALFVWLDAHDISGIFTTNGFAMIGGTEQAIFLANAPTTLEALTAALTVTHLRDPVHLG